MTMFLHMYLCLVVSVSVDTHLLMYSFSIAVFPDLSFFFDIKVWSHTNYRVVNGTYDW